MSLHTSVEMSCSTALEDRITMAAARILSADPVDWMQKHKHTLCAQEEWADAWEKATDEFEKVKAKYGFSEFPEFGKTEDVISDKMIIDSISEIVAAEAEALDKLAEEEHARQEAARAQVVETDTH